MTDHTVTENENRTLPAEEIMKIVRRAGDIILHASKNREEHITKAGHANFATAYDEAVQEFLISRLGELLPEARFLGEEDGKDLFRKEYKTGLLFVIDPIDGTSNFIYGYAPSVISVALFSDGSPAVGIVYNPYTGQIFAAEKGKGAFLYPGEAAPSVSDERDGGSCEIAGAVRLRVTEKPLAECLVSFGTSPYRSDLAEKTFRKAGELMEKCVDVRRSGSAAWDLCLLSSGVTGLVFEYTLGLWDYAAGALLVEEAGGTVTDIEGRPLAFDGPSSILARGAGVRREELDL